MELGHTRSIDIVQPWEWQVPSGWDQVREQKYQAGFPREVSPEHGVEA